MFDDPDLSSEFFLCGYRARMVRKVRMVDSTLQSQRMIRMSGVRHDGHISSSLETTYLWCVSHGERVS